MARKGQKFKKYSPEFKAEAVRRFLAGEGGSKRLSKELGVPRKTVASWIAKHKAGGDPSSDGRGKGSKGRPKSGGPTKEDLKEQVEILKKYQAFLRARTGRK